MDQQDDQQDNKQIEPLADLEVSAEQASETKAGTLGSGGGTGKVNVHDIQLTKN